jgi:hypothetical protein
MDHYGHRGLCMVMRYAHLSPAYLSSKVALLDAATGMPPLPEETRGGKTARKGQRAPRRTQAQALA